MADEDTDVVELVFDGIPHGLDPDDARQLASVLVQAAEAVES